METLEELAALGKARLYPSITDPNWLILSQRRKIFQRWLGRIEQSELRVLDVGGRIQPYRPLLEGRLHQYLAVDMRRTPLVDVVGQGEHIPLASGYFDLVICTQVLEYVFDPSAALAEMYRVLKPGGVLLLSVPSVFPRDSEHECWRFLPAALRQLLAGFAEVEIVPEGGSITGFFRTINACLNIFARFQPVRAVLRVTIFPLVNLLGWILEIISGSSNDQFAANYSVLACK